MNELTFAHADWFWGVLLLLPLLVLRLRSQFQGRRRLPGLVSPRLAHRLVNGASQARRWAAFLLQGLAVIALLAALARPRWGYEEVETEVDARNLLIAIDTSRSMLSDDLPPDRLERAKLAAKDIVLSLPEDRIGLMAFAGKPFLQAPLTTDHEAVLEAIDQIDTEIIPRGGTNLSAAVALAAESLEEMKAESGVLVLFSDGEDLEGGDQVAAVLQRAEQAGLGIVAVGVGTPQGSIIPEVDEEGNLVPGAFVKDEAGQVVRTRLQPESLQALAARGGTYLHLGGPGSLTEVVDRIRQGIAGSRDEAETARRPIERFLWPLSAAAVCLVLSHLLPLFWLKPARASRPTPLRRSAVGAGLLALLSLPLAASGADPLAGGAAAFAREDFPAALSAYEAALGEARPSERSRLQMGIGAAAYRLGNFERAAEAYGEAVAGGDSRLRSEAYYNLGNTLFRRGETILQPGAGKAVDRDLIQALVSDPTEAMERTEAEWKSAIEHFESSLALDPDNPQAAHNLAYVKKRLEELEKQRQQQEQQQQKQEQQTEDKQKEEEKEKDKEDKKEKDQDEEVKKDQDKKDGQDPEEKKDGSEDPGQDPPQDPGKDPGSDSKNPPDPGKSDPPQDPGSGKEKDQPAQEPPGGDSDPDKPKDPGESDRPQDPSQNPGEEPPPPEAPQDGKLEANPDPGRPDQAKAAAADPAEQQTNPNTGYSPSEARQLLDALADETEVRPLRVPARNEKFKNW